MSSHGDEDHSAVLTEINKVGHVKHAKEEDNSTSKPSSSTDLCIDKQVPSVTTTERFSIPQDHSYSINVNQKDHKLKSAKAQLGEVREENERLKLTLAQVMKDYQSLQMYFHVIVQKEEAKKSTDTSPTEDDQERELVSLSLGRASSGPKKDEIKKSSINSRKGKEDDKFDIEGLKLGLDCRFDKNPSSENSFEESKEDNPKETWTPSKNLKTERSGDEDVLQQNPLKKARVSIRAICDTSTMNDGCQWRKYGQKIAKGNPCPRAYYRCTISPSCPVRRQVQRCAEDMSILITTYEGTHNHPLPPSATAMASTTSAAASMLKSASSSSQPGHGTLPTTTTADLHGLNFTLTNNSRPHPFYLPNSTISTSQSHPTITLDLTAPPSSSAFNRPLSSSFPSAPRYSTSLNFSSSLTSNTLQTSWANNYLNYRTLSNNYNRNYIGTSYLTRHLQPYMSGNTLQPPQESMTETIAAATKAVTANPTFQSALEAAITSFVGAGEIRANQSGEENSRQKVMLDECFSVNNGYPSDQYGIRCATSYLNRLPSLKSQQGSLTLFPSSLPFSASKSPPVSPPGNGDHIK